MTGVTDDTTCDCLTAERSVVRLLGATCNTPVGVHATAAPSELAQADRLRRACRTARAGSATSWRCRHPHGAGLVGHHVAERLRAAGADELLAEAERAGGRRIAFSA